MRNRIENKFPVSLVEGADIEATRQACAEDFIRDVIIPEYEREGYDVEIDFYWLHYHYKQRDPQKLGMDFSLEDVLDKLDEYVFERGDYGDLNLTLLCMTYYRLSGVLGYTS